MFFLKVASGRKIRGIFRIARRPYRIIAKAHATKEPGLKMSTFYEANVRYLASILLGNVSIVVTKLFLGNHRHSVVFFLVPLGYKFRFFGHVPNSVSWFPSAAFI